MTAVEKVKPRKLGAPTLYREEYCEQLVDFFESAPLIDPGGEYQEPQAQGGSLKREVRAICAAVPTFERFAASINVTPSALWEWSKRHPLFGEAYARAKAAQSNFFTQGLAQGVMNPTGAIFVAKNILGWRDKIDIDQTTGTAGDTASMDKVRDALGRATPEQLEAFTALLDKMAAQPSAVTIPITSVNRTGE